MIRSHAALISIGLCALFLSHCTSHETIAPPETAKVSHLSEPISQPIAASDKGQFVKIAEFESQFIQPRGLTIWLPPGYDPTNQKYPVIYAHDGQNLMETEGSYRGVEWNLDEVSTRLIKEEKARPAIIVGIWNTDKRWWEYAPEKIINNLPEEAFAVSEDNPEGVKPELYSDAYLKFIVEELKPYIDSNYATAPGRENTSIMGSSMGGLISLYALAEYPEVFSKAACLSTHWVLARPESPAANAATQAILAYLDSSKIGEYPQTIWFDHGTIELDQYYARHSVDIEAWFRENGWDKNAAQFRVYEGTGHKEEYWASRAHEYLAFLMAQ
ncbi:alpha/beta hydrolase [Hirschia baltica]|uniref:Putative esterase n=1 Tax=Hirschia baltica (strain ATCC 49814 / DSM 5838 / IFAM 1418) TaxID=582402 RepID=C6XR15_HIRBI|nr:alpha/beta fold hydrolase [Hirschia baltica]ACT60546.1 putative esterase [Hirschia baltica ATCC 49814]